MAPKKVVKIMNQKGQKGNKVTMLVDERVNKKGKVVNLMDSRKQQPSQSMMRAQKKAADEAQKAELKQIFNTVATKEELEAKKKRKEDRERKLLEEKAKKEGGISASALATDAYAHLHSQEEDYLWTADDFDAVEEDETRLEEQLQKELEELRANLESGKVKGTKITPETFKAWKDKKKKEQAQAAKKAKQKAIKENKMTGKLLYELNSAIFKDDEDAYGDDEWKGEEDEEAEVEAKDKEKADDTEVDAALFDGGDLEVEDVE